MISIVTCTCFTCMKLSHSVHDCYEMHCVCCGASTCDHQQSDDCDYEHVVSMERSTERIQVRNPGTPGVVVKQ